MSVNRVQLKAVYNNIHAVKLICNNILVKENKHVKYLLLLYCVLIIILVINTMDKFTFQQNCIM